MNVFNWVLLDPRSTSLEVLVRQVNLRMQKLSNYLDAVGTFEAVKSFPNGAATPGIAGAKTFLASNTVPTTITSFRDGVGGREIIVWATTGNTTIQHSVGSPGIRTKSGANIVMGANETRRFLSVDGLAFREV